MVNYYKNKDMTLLNGKIITKTLFFLYTCTLYMYNADKFKYKLVQIEVKVINNDKKNIHIVQIQL